MNIDKRTLMLGNWVKRIHKQSGKFICYEIVSNINIKYGSYYNYGDLPSSTVEPISITEEILLKVGFKENKDWGVKCFIIEHNNINIFFEKLVDGWWLSLPGLESFTVEHLHTAQNLILILTGKALKIEL